MGPKRYLVLLFGVVATLTHADMYKCVEDGRTVFQELPCKGGGGSINIRPQAGDAPVKSTGRSGNNPAASNGTVANKDAPQVETVQPEMALWEEMSTLRSAGTTLELKVLRCTREFLFKADCRPQIILQQGVCTLTRQNKHAKEQTVYTGNFKTQVTEKITIIPKFGLMLETTTESRLIGTCTPRKGTNYGWSEEYFKDKNGQWIERQYTFW